MAVTICSQDTFIGTPFRSKGADILDIGGESTAGSRAVPIDKEIERIQPVIELVISEKVALSIDTKAGGRCVALEAGPTL